MDIFTQFPATADNPNGFSRGPIPEITNYMSYSRVKTMAESMAHFKRRYIDGVKPEDTPDKAFGRLVHEMLLEPSKFQANYSIKPEKSDYSGLLDTVADLKVELKAKKITAKAGLKKEDLEDLLLKADRFYRTRILRFIIEDYEKNLTETSVQVTNKQADLILNMIKAIDEKVIGVKRARQLLVNGEPEVCAYWQDEELGVTWFIRLDYIRAIKLMDDQYLFWITDVKTTKNASYDGFKKEIAQWNYHLQNLIYRRVVRGITGSKVNLTNIAVEKADPIGVGVYEPETRADDMAAWEIRRYLEKWRWCQSVGRYPKYEEQIVQTGLPNWRYYQLEELAELEGES